MSVQIPLRCKCRRQAITTLRCARCSVLICPDCSIITPAGMICKVCSRPSPILHEVSPGSYVKTWLVTLPSAFVIGWFYWTVCAPFGFFSWILAYFYGVAVAEVAKHVSDRRRGVKMEILAGVAAGIGLLSTAALTDALFMRPSAPILIIIGTVAAVIRLRFL